MKESCIAAGPGRRPSRHRRAATVTAVSVMALLPTLGFVLAPAAHADDSPGANLAGIDASASASGVQISPLTPGLVGAGNVRKGNLVEADIPYASSSASTGPTNSSVASPAYPGATAAGAGNAISTFAPQFPAALTQMLNYPALAQADYPAQLSTGTSSTYSPPGASGTGVGTASANAAENGSTSSAAISQTAFATAGISVASGMAESKTVVGASTVTASAHTGIGTVELLGGLIKIAGISSDASATSDGNTGQQTSDFKLGAVTVAGVPASIGPNGITLEGSGPASFLVPDANQALVALKQAGISVHTIAPTTTYDGAQASVTSAALVVQFQDANIPNPNGQVPVSSLGLDLNLGLTQASADATALPPIGSLGGFSSIPSGGSLGSATSGPVTSSGGVVALPSTPGGGGASLSGPPPAVASAPSQAPATAGTGTAASPAPPVVSPPATLLGAPVKVAWVVIAFLLSLVVSGPLLGYANWQLLRGRKS